ncbi:MAG: hypothetical protein IH897_13400, partial [Planctomycetes bacterium]|nr:hypothetical protein [Planctomycetota bacterium]
AANPETAAASATPPADPLAEAAAHLHTAFDTTFVALVLSLILMYFLHRVQAEQDMFLAKATDWCLQRLPFRMHISKETPS